MRFIIFLLIFSCSQVISGEYEDESLRTKIVGSWILPKDNSAIGAIIEFKNNGSWVAYIYASPKCAIKVSEAYGDWVVKNKRLQTIVTGSSLFVEGGIVFPAGYTNIDTIISVDLHNLILRDETGNNLKRIRGESCQN